MGNNKYLHCLFAWMDITLTLVIDREVVVTLLTVNIMMT